jgi:hypothetical protein
MKSCQPPRLGKLILERLGPRNVDIVGDLSEEWRWTFGVLVLEAGAGSHCISVVGNERFYFLVRNSLGHERFVPYLMGYLFQCGVVMVVIVIGGLAHPPRIYVANSPCADPARRRV